MKIELLDGGIYAATIAFQQRLRFRADGWLWNPDLKKWTTKDRTKVIPWLPFCVGRAREVLDDQIEHERVRMAPSFAADADIDIPVPVAFHIRDRKPFEYHPFQKAGIKFIHEHKDTLLADPPGLGKTIQAIGASNLDASIRRVLIICPAFMKIHWERTWTDWDVKHLSVGIARTHSYQKDRVIHREHVWPNSDVVIINPELLEAFDEHTKALEWDSMVIDEWHLGFPTGKSKRFKSVFGGRYTKPKKKEKAEAGDDGLPSDTGEEAPVSNRDSPHGEADSAVVAV